MSDNLLPASVTCGKCGARHDGLAKNTWEYIATMRAAGWIIPNALDNKPIQCPQCVGAKS